MYAALVAIAEPMGTDELVPTFADDQLIAKALNSLCQFGVLSQHDLSRPLADFDLSELATAELEQVRY
ncbi:hypothetical protein [Nocardia aobensis]|uniref:hypothetical protein n=1 Tax=Nocardia aobensis TaxID=257277 RepID=UPI00031F0C09|nr:hypothetical protein [Nocardia aobensis]